MWGFKVSSRVPRKWKRTFCVCVRYSVATLANCGSNTFCSNNIGSYQCGCISGNFAQWVANTGIKSSRWIWFSLSFVSLKGCLDINECEDPASCGPNTICTNSIGSFSCACLPGYELWSAGQGCSDIDECQHPDWRQNKGWHVYNLWLRREVRGC